MSRKQGANTRKMTHEMPGPRPVRRWPRRITVVAAVVIVAGVAWVIWSISAKRVTSDELNVLLITLDTTRADHLGCYGNLQARTPNIDRLAREGTLFRQCFAATSTTLPSHSSIMTGNYPFVHGARTNIQHVLAVKNVTLAEAARNAGLKTGAVIAAAVLDADSGIDQGFERYDDLQSAQAIGAALPADLARTLDPALSRSEHERRADEVCARAIGWLRGHTDDRFFLWVHFFDPHGPFEPPTRFLVGNPNRYLGEIDFVDEQLGRLLRELDHLGIKRRTLIVLAADHGEGLGQHGEKSHSYFVYDTTQWVPLIMWLPGMVPRGHVVESQVRTIDIAPTILDMLALPPMPGIAGVSLRPYLAHAGPGLPAYSETLVPYYVLGCAAPRCLRADGWKYIRAPQAELYHVAVDPREVTNVAASNPERVASMRRELENLVLSGAPEEAEHADNSVRDDAAERLMALGYVAGSSAQLAQTEQDLLTLDAPDVKERIDDIDRMGQGLVAMKKNRLAEAEAAFRELTERMPDNASLLSLLGSVLSKEDRKAEAIDTFRRVLELDPDDADAQGNLGDLYARAGDHDAALRHNLVALEHQPRKVDVRIAIQQEWVRRGRYSAAVDLLREGLKLTPGQLVMSNNLAWLLATCPDPDVRNGAEAIRLASNVVDVTGRSDPSTLDTLAAALAEAGRYDEAVATARRAVELAAAAGQSAAADTIRARLSLYEQHKPCREP